MKGKIIMSAGKGFLSALIGGVDGGAVAFFFAPKKGKDVRKEIKNNFDNLINQTKEKSNSK